MQNRFFSELLFNFGVVPAFGWLEKQNTICDFAKRVKKHSKLECYTFWGALDWGLCRIFFAILQKIGVFVDMCESGQRLVKSRS